MIGRQRDGIGGSVDRRNVRQAHCGGIFRASTASKTL